MKKLTLLLLMVLFSSWAKAEDNLIATLQLTAQKGETVTLYMVATKKDIKVDPGDGNLVSLEVTEEMPDDPIQGAPKYTVKCAADNPSIKIYGDGLRVLLYPYPGSSCTLTDINLDGADDLEALEVDNSGLTSLNVSPCTNLRILLAFGNPGLTSLDVTNNTLLEQLQIQMTGIKTLDLSNQSHLKSIYAFGNYAIPLSTFQSLSQLDLSHCPEVEEVIAYDGDLEELNISGCEKLSRLWVNKSKLSQLTMKDNIGLSDVQFQNCSNLESVAFEEMPNVESLDFSNTLVSMADLSSLSNLKSLTAYGCKLTAIKVSAEAQFESPIVLSSNLLDACALDEFYNSLGAPSTSNTNNYIYLGEANEGGDNPGLTTSKTSIAEEKGWQVGRFTADGSFEKVEGDGTGCTDAIETLQYDKNSCVKIIGQTLSINFPFTVGRLNIYNISGKCVMSLNKPETSISLSTLPHGVYILHVNGTNGEKEEVSFTM